MRFFIELSYNGKLYHGWQIQPNANTVQQTLENGLNILLGTQISVVGAGRTDTGVHAQQMYAHFDCNETMEIPNLIYKLNSYLPKDIAIRDIKQVKDDAHARFDALSRTYTYRIGFKKNVFNFESAYYIKMPLDLDKMKAASEILLHYKNFKCFSRSNTDVKTYNCGIKSVSWSQTENELVFKIQADRFLRNMVRAIVGTLVEIGLHKIEVEAMHEIISSQDRAQAGPSAPAHGLYLSEIEYPNNIFL